MKNRLYFLLPCILFSLIICSNLYAQDAKCQLLAIKASNSGTGVDSKINSYITQLQRPPFSSFSKFDLLKNENITLSLNNTASFQNIAGNINGSLTLERIQNSLLFLRLILNRGGTELLRTLVSVTRGHPFFIAGPSVSDGTLIMGIICQ